MKSLLLMLLSLSLIFTSVHAKNVSSSKYRNSSEALTDLALLQQRVNSSRKSLRDKIRQQVNNYEVKRQLEHARAKMDEMIKRNNISKACKVVELGFTAATLGIGGVASVGAEGLSIMSREGMKQAAKYIGKKGAVEVGKEVAGVPGYSDSVKAGVYIFNKYDENELKSQLGRGDIELLLRAKKLLEDETDGRTLEEKLPEFRAIMFEAEERVENMDNQIKGVASYIDKGINEAGAIAAEARRLKDEERKKEEQAVEAARIKKPAKRIPTSQPVAAEVPQPAVGPKDTEEEKRKKIQEAIDQYIKSLSARLKNQFDTADEVWKSVKHPSSSSPGNPGELRNWLSEIETQLPNMGTYSELQNMEYFARNHAEALKIYRNDLEMYRLEIKGKIEPLMSKIAETIGKWRTVYNTYEPLGFSVPYPPNIEGTNAWNAYYEGPLSSIEEYMSESEGLESAYSGLSSQAASRKDAVYSTIKAFATDYSSRAQDFKNSAHTEVKRIKSALDDFQKKSAPILDLPRQFALQFGYEGKREPAALEPLIAAAKLDYSAAQDAHMAVSMLFFGLKKKQQQLEEMRSDPLMGEAYYVSSLAQNAAHKTEMNAVLNSLSDFSPWLDELSGLDSFLPQSIESISGIIFAAEEVQRYLLAAEKRMLDVANDGLSKQKALYAQDLSHLKTASDEEYAKEMERLSQPYNTTMEKIKEIEEEVRSTFLFDPTEELKPQKISITNTPNGPMVQGKEPLLFRTGFFPASVTDRIAQFDKNMSDFWNSAVGQEISEARRMKELRQAQDRRDPGSVTVRKMYEDFKQAYESRNVARVISFIDGGWTAQDGSEISDLEEHLSRIFRVFNEISFNISNLNIVNEGNGIYTVSYDLDITSKIYSKNIKREEKSSVYEKVKLENGKAKIFKTENGSYWMIK